MENVILELLKENTEIRELLLGNMVISALDILNKQYNRLYKKLKIKGGLKIE